MLVGGATLLLFPLSWGLQAALGVSEAELAAGFVMFHAAYVINDPHFSVTYLLFYRDVKARAAGPSFGGAQRVRYWLAGFILPALLLAWAAAALWYDSSALLGAMIQLMFLLVGWHYAKQGFGVVSVLARRRGVHITARERRALLLHAYAGWAFAWSNPSMPALQFEEKGVVYWGIAHPRWLELGCGAVLAASGVVLMFTLASEWRRHGRVLPLAPVLGFLITIWAWMVFSAIDPVVRYVIPALHSVQYLYFVALMKRNEARAAEGPPHFGRPAQSRLVALALSAIGLGWVLFHGLPALLDELFAAQRGEIVQTELGPMPLSAALFAFVNIHHYLMDSVIWRKGNPEMRHLGGGKGPTDAELTRNLA